MSELLLPAYNWIKVLHLASVIAWMAGMMYLPRLFIYQHQAQKGGEAEGLFIPMQRRLLKGIMNPAMIATWIFGILLVVAMPVHLSTAWFGIKFLFVLAMSGVHGFYAASHRKFAVGERPKTEKFWRMMNEVPFVFLLVILVMVLVKPFL